VFAHEAGIGFVVGHQYGGHAGGLDVLDKGVPNL
jgi:hypothetical protein